MADINEIRFSGKLEKPRAIDTKTGTSMTVFLLKVGKERFKCVCFKNLADKILECSDGARVTVSGSGGIRSWKDNDDHWHNDFQVTAWGIELHGEQFSYKKKRKAAKRSTSPPPEKKYTQDNSMHDDLPF